MITTGTNHSTLATFVAGFLTAASCGVILAVCRLSMQKSRNEHGTLSIGDGAVRKKEDEQESSKVTGDRLQCSFRESSFLKPDTEGSDRYARQRLILGWDGQESIKRGSCLVIGCGGLASGCVPLLAGAGIQRIGLVDNDLVEVSNLHRQTLHSTETIGQRKVESGYAYIRRLNPEAQVDTYAERIETKEQLVAILREQTYDVVIDCSDNMETRYIVNAVCVAFHKPLVSASALGTFGQLGVFWPSRFPQAGCYRCAFPIDLPSVQQGNCSSEGVLGPLPTILGALQALETLKLLAFYFSRDSPFVGDNGAFQPKFQCGQVLLNLDLANLQQDPFATLKLRRNPGCPDCSNVVASEIVQNSTAGIVMESTAIDPQWLVVDVRPLTDCIFPQAHIRIEMSLLRKNPKDISRMILAKATEEHRTGICFVCRQGITSRSASHILAYQQQQILTEACTEPAKVYQLFTLQGGIGQGIGDLHGQNKVTPY